MFKQTRKALYKYSPFTIYYLYATSNIWHRILQFELGLTETKSNKEGKLSVAFGCYQADSVEACQTRAVTKSNYQPTSIPKDLCINKLQPQSDAYVGCSRQITAATRDT